MARILGIDYGSSKVGVAIADDETLLASPLEIIKGATLVEQQARIKSLVLSEGIKKIIIGVPFSKDGKASAQTKKARTFIDGLTKMFAPQVQVIAEDERMTTKMSQKLIADEVHRDDDSVAAAIILQSYLDREYKR